MKNRLMTVFLFALIWLSLTVSIAQSQADASSLLDELIDEGLKNNPEFLAAQYNLKMSETLAPQAGALPDPVLGFSVMNLPVNSFDFNREPMTGKKISLMQMFPFPGKLGLKKDMAQYQAQVVEFQVAELKNNLIKNIKQTYFNIFSIEKNLELAEKNKQLLNQFVNVAETKYSVGKGLQQDVLKAQVELSKMIDRIISLQQKRSHLIFRLNQLLNRDINSALNQLPTFEITPVAFQADSLKILGLENRPLLKSWDYLLKKANAADKLANKGYLPDFNLGVAYTQREDLRSGAKMVDFFSAEISLNLPIYFFTKQAKNAEEAGLNLLSLDEKFSALKNDVLFQIEDACSEVIKNRKLVDLYKTGIIPQASQSLNSAISGYQVDKVDFLTLVNNQMTLFNYEIEYYRVIADYEKSLAELEAAAGVLFKNRI